MSQGAERLWVRGQTFPYSTKQVNKAGDRIRRASVSGAESEERDRDLLDIYRSSHYPGSREVQERLSRLVYRTMGLQPLRDIEVNTVSARPLKTHDAITAKLVRERTRLATIQDIAGARIVVPDPRTQDEVCQAILERLPGLKPRIAKDTRSEADELGYRALHVVVATDHPGVGKCPAEIQIRTIWQEAWAQVVEEIDGAVGTDLKHGEGAADAMTWLRELSDAFQSRENGVQVTIPRAPATLSA